MIHPSDLLPVGETGKTHGLKGEINCEFTKDFDMESCTYFVFEMDGILVPFFIEDYRFRNDDTALVIFSGLKSESDVRELSGKTIYVNKEMMIEEDDDELTAYSMIGFTLVNEKGENLGVINGVDDQTENILFELGEHLIPVASVEILGLDVENKVAVVEIPEGLLDLLD